MFLVAILLAETGIKEQMIFSLHLRFILFSHTSILHFISQFDSWHCIAFTWNSSFVIVFDFFFWPNQITNYLSIIFTCGKPSLAWKFNCFSCLRVFDYNLQERYTSTYEKSFLALIILYIRRIVHLTWTSIRYT